MEHSYNFLSLCCHKISYKLMVLAIIILHFSSTVYLCINMPPYPDEYRFLTEDWLMYMMSQTQAIASLINVIVSLVWFFLNRNIICDVEVGLNILSVSLISDASVRNCFKAMFSVYLTIITLMMWNVINYKITWTVLPSLVVFLISVSFNYACSALLSCSFLQLGSFFNDITCFNKHEDSVLRYERISSIFEKICHLFKLPTFFIVSWSFLLILCDLYIIFITPYYDWYSLQLFLYIACYLFPILIVIRCCNELNKKAKHFNQKLYWEMVEDKSSKLLKNEKLNFHFLVNEEIIFTVCGFFRIDNSLIFSMISIATTYLVIFLQYQRNGEDTVPSTTTPTFELPSQAQTIYN